MDFDPNLSLNENLELFKAAAEALDPECAKVLFDNIEKLQNISDDHDSRAAIREFNQAVLQALNASPETDGGEVS